MLIRDTYRLGLFFLFSLLTTVGCGSEGSYPSGGIIPARSAPEAPSNLAPTETNATTVTLAWKNNDPFDLTFSIERTEENAQERISQFQEIATVGGDETSFQDTDLSPVTTYIYRVRAVNALGASDFSNELTVTTLDQIPTPPDNLTIVAPSDTEVLLYWNDNSNNEDGFVVRYKKSADLLYRSAPPIAADQTEVALGNLEAGATYLFYVYAYNEAGDSAPTNTVEHTME